MKLLHASLALVTLLAISTAAPAFAHVNETNNGIGAVIHINPDDDPIAGKPSTIFFELSDTANRLSLPNCSCVVTVRQDTNEIGSIKLQGDKALISSFGFTFPTQDLYIIELSGRPKTSGAFNDFVIKTSVRVNRGAVVAPAPDRPKQQQSPLLIASLSVLTLIILGITGKIVYNVKYK